MPTTAKIVAMHPERLISESELARRANRDVRGIRIARESGLISPAAATPGGIRLYKLNSVGVVLAAIRSPTSRADENVIAAEVYRGTSFV